MWLAYHKAARGKRGRGAAASFELTLADHLIDLQQDLLSGEYRPGAYKHFYIREPKRRKISAAPFRDRVVHHALCNVIEPHFDRCFYPHSYANRREKGTHRAIDTLQTMARRYRYVLRLDIVKHFPSIDHQILAETLFREIGDDRIRKLIQKIIKSGEGILDDELRDLERVDNRPRGLPIGNLTSQFWSNCYLNPFDWFVARELGCPGYIRYVDDFALFADSKKLLHLWKREIVQRLAKMQLRVHESRAQVYPTGQGIPWLGWIVFPTHRRLKRRNAINFQRRLGGRLDDYRAGKISFAELDASVQGWINHVRYGDTWGLRRALFESIRV